MRSPLACPHIGHTLHSTPSEKSNLTPQRLQFHVRMCSLVSCPRSSALNLTNEEIELSQCPRRPRVVEVAAVRDREALYVAPQPRPHPHTQSNGTATLAQSRPVPWWAHVVLFLCCVSPQHTNGNTKPTQQQQQQCQPQGPAQPEASLSQTQSAAASTSVAPPAPATSPTPPNAANMQSRPLLSRVRLVLFLCCTSPPHADGH